MSARALPLRAVVVQLRTCFVQMANLKQHVLNFAMRLQLRKCAAARVKSNCDFLWSLLFGIRALRKLRIRLVLHTMLHQNQAAAKRTAPCSNRIHVIATAAITD